MCVFVCVSLEFIMSMVVRVSLRSIIMCAWLSVGFIIIMFVWCFSLGCVIGMCVCVSRGRAIMCVCLY